MKKKTKQSDSYIRELNLKTLFILWLFSFILYPLLSILFPDYFFESSFSDFFVGNITFYEIAINAILLPIFVFFTMFLLVFSLNGAVFTEKKSWPWILKATLLIAALINLIPAMNDFCDISNY